MSEKRYFLHKRLGRDVIHDTLCHNWLEREELEEHMNVQYTKYSDLKKENENLKSRIKDYDVALKRLQDLADKKLTENGYLAKEKERYKRLSEIRREEINNRILTIKEFIENCSDNKVKKILEDLFYSEVKEYDLSTQNRKLLHENEQLKFCSDKLQKELIKKVEEKAKLKTENQGLQFKIIDMLDFVKDKGTVTREEIKEWWNNSQRGDNLCIGYVAREDK